MPTIYEIRTKTGKLHRTKAKRAERIDRAYAIKVAAERDGLNPVETREAVKRYLHTLGLSTNAFYSHLNTVMAMREPLQTEMSRAGMGRIGTLTP